MVGELIQILLAIGIVVLLFVIVFFVYNKEMVKMMKEASRTKNEVPIFIGIMDLETTKDIRYTTQDKTSANYKNLVPSYNQKAGAEFTYNFWLFTDLTDEYPLPDQTDQVSVDPGLSTDDLILFVKGSKTAYAYSHVCAKSILPTDTDDSTTKTDILVKCPLVKLQRGGDVLTVEFNTLSNPEAIRESAHDVCDDMSSDWNYMNGHKLAVSGLRTGPNASNYDKKWYMVTIIIQDTTPLDPLPIRNKCRCRIYVNNMLELDRYVDGSIGGYDQQSVLRTNKGDLYFAPIVTFKDNTTSEDKTTKTVKNARKIMMADFVYNNYAIDPSTIASRFKEGFKKEFSPVITVPVNDPVAGGNVWSVSAAAEKKQLVST